MAKKKDYLNSISSFISQPIEEPTGDQSEAIEEASITNNESKKYTLEEAKELLISDGYKRSESKSKRLNLLIRPSLYEKLKEKATSEGISVNSLIDTIIEKYLEE